MSHKSSDGTSHLRRHIFNGTCPKAPEKYKKNNNDNVNNKSTLLQHFPKKNTKNDFTKHEKKILLEKQVNVSIIDLKPITTTEGDGILDLIQYCVDLAAKKGSFNVRETLYGRTSVGKGIQTKSNDVQQTKN